MDKNTVISALQEKFGEKVISVTDTYGIPAVTVTKDIITELIRWLSDPAGNNFSFLTDLTGIHYPDQKGNELGVVYHLQNMTDNLRIRVKTFMSADNPEIPSVTGIFSAANWMERETYDFYGIRFQGHPNLTRILNMEEMDYFPMLKQYPLEDQKREDKDDRFFGR